MTMKSEINREREWKYLFGLVKSAVTDQMPPVSVETLDWKYLYETCKVHKIDNMLCYGVLKLPKEKGPSKEIMDELIKAKKVGEAKEAVQHFSLEAILEEFEKQEISCMPLKGILLKKFYPFQDMRMMADLDILYRPEQKDKIRSILEAQGYEMEDNECEHHDVYYRKPYMNIEMHHMMVSADNEQSEYYRDIWERARINDGKRFTYHLSWEDFYVYMIVHMAKHFYHGGIGIRSVIDIWVFLKEMRDKLDYGYIEKELNKLQLSNFNRCMLNLAEIWFEDRESSKIYDDMTGFIINSGIYGNREHSELEQIILHNNSENSIKYGQFMVRWRMIFLPYHFMKLQYPYLNRFPVLLPVAWVQRFFRSVLFRRERVAAALKRADVDKGEALRLQKLFEELNL